MVEQYWPWFMALWMLSGFWCGWVTGISGRSKTVGCPNCHNRIKVFEFRNHFKECA